MPAHTAHPVSKTTILKRRVVAILALAAIGTGAALVPSMTSAHGAPVHAYLAKDGSTVVSGYDGGVAVAKP